MSKIRPLPQNETFVLHSEAFFKIARKDFCGNELII